MKELTFLCLIVGVIACLLLPLPPAALDLLLCANLLFSLLLLGSTLTIGEPLQLSALPSVLLVLTLIVSTLTLGNGRTTILQGVVHLAIFAAYLFLSIVP